MVKAVFLDRDGVINYKAPENCYVTHWDEMYLYPDVASAIARLNRAGFRVFVISNQRCIAKGLITEADLVSLHRRMCDELARSGAIIDAVYYCPHDTHPPCTCRKPAPGMLLDAARDHQLDLPASWMIGDSDTDIKAGRRAGCKTARLQSVDAPCAADVLAASLTEAVDRILDYDRSTIFTHEIS
ncbi:MAG TPA: HAD family hydrolase [Bryobacteraceae bacterium]|nr:HAD family hydrolase [Bryobacteraceae bacterium]